MECIMPQKPPKPSKPADRAASLRVKNRRGVSAAGPLLSLRQLSREIPTSDEFDKLDDDIMKAHDRAAAILMASQLELCLEYRIYGKFRRRDEKLLKVMTDNNGPMASFHGKILLAYALGVIDQHTRQCLDTIRDIRNAFAHAFKPITFATPQIQSLCEQLRQDYLAIDTEVKVARSPLAFVFAGSPENPNRQIFTGAFQGLKIILLSPPPRDG